MRYSRANRTLPVLLMVLIFWSCEDDGIEQSSFTDPRDNKTYKAIKVGGTKWMAEDLHFNDSTTFSYQQSLNICPPGWSMPAEEDWIKLCNYFGGYVYDGQDIGDPKKAHDRMQNEFNIEQGYDWMYYWTSSPAWVDVPSMRSSLFIFTNEVVEYGFTLVSSKMRCRCINREKQKTSDVIEFRLDEGNTLRYDFYSFQQPEMSDEIYFIIHRKIEGKVLVDRVVLGAKLPAKFIGENDQAIEASSATLQYEFNDKGTFDSVIRSFSSDLDFKLLFTFFDGKKVEGTFSGTSYDGVVIEDGYFELALIP